MIRALALFVVAGALAACAPKAPDGVDKAVLDTAINTAIGDPGTCVLIAKGGESVYRFGSNVVCGRSLPTCEGAATRTAADFLAAGDPPSLTASCPSTPDGQRIVAWARGPIEGSDLVYAAVMEGPNTPPGVVVADKLKSAFRKAGL